MAQSSWHSRPTRALPKIDAYALFFGTADSAGNSGFQSRFLSRASFWSSEEQEHEHDQDQETRGAGFEVAVVAIENRGL
jgi:hypothetical protein